MAPDEADRLRRDVDDHEVRLRDIEREGTRITGVRIEALTGRVSDLEEEAKDNRRMVRSAIIAATLSLVASLLGGLLLWALTRGGS